MALKFLPQGTGLLAFPPFSQEARQPVITGPYSGGESLRLGVGQGRSARWRTDAACSVLGVRAQIVVCLRLGRLCSRCVPNRAWVAPLRQVAQRCPAPKDSYESEQH